MSWAELYRFTSKREGPPPVSEPASPDSASDTHPFGLRVLITEDNWLIASEWEIALQEAGYEVLGVAVSADEALQMCLADRPDFVLMDIRLLGRRDGVELAIELRERLELPSIFVSAHDDQGTRRRAAPARPLGWIAKPFVADRIAELIQGLARPAH